VSNFEIRDAQPIMTFPFIQVSVENKCLEVPLENTINKLKRQIVK
jgi:hypothetical protein